MYNIGICDDGKNTCAAIEEISKADRREKAGYRD